MVFYIVVSGQIGVGILGFVRYIAKVVEQDNWIVVILSGATIHVIIYMMYYILNTHNNDIVHIQQKLFGKWLGNIVSILLSFYFLLGGMTVLRTYIEVVQTWMFPNLQVWSLSLLYILLSYYVISFGFRSVVGMCVLSFLFSFGLSLLITSR
nr:GerAB/ArcD/ProY family transporter [Metabacillus iocasae]